MGDPSAERCKAARLLGLWVLIPPGGMDICLLRMLCVFRSLCVGLITRPEDFYRLWRVWVWSWILDNYEALAHWGLLRQVKIKCQIWEVSSSETVKYFGIFVSCKTVYSGWKVPCLGSNTQPLASYIPKKEAVYFSETVVATHQTTTRSRKSGD
jgi:hypothetical protein